MKIIPLQVVSDLHLDEFDEYSVAEMIRPQSEILLLAGDICHIEKAERHRDFFQYISQSFQYVVYVPGNHEFYSERASVETLESAMKLFLKDFSNIFYLNNESVLIKNILFTGSCLWCNPTVNPPDWFMVRATKYKIREMHRRSLAYLNEVTATPRSRHVIVTHYPPIKIERKKTKYCTKYDEYYQNDTIHLLHPPQLWIFGHNHQNCKIQTNSTLYLANQRKGKSYQPGLHLPFVATG